METYLGERNVRVQKANESVVSSLYSEDGSGSGNVARVGDVTSSSEVGGDTNVLNDLRETEERLNVGVRERILAALGGIRYTSGLKTGGKEGYVSCFIGGDSVQRSNRQ
jgi:hypothetical protein